MLPNSEEHFLTSVSERKQLLNESLRSNLYYRKTKGTIVNNTTSGKMFDVTETQTTLVTGENLDDYNYVVLPSFNPGSQSWKMYYKINTKDGAGYDNSIFGQLTNYRSIIVKVKNNRFVMYASSGNSWDIASGYSGSYSVQNNTDYVIDVTFDGSKYVLSYSLDDGKTFTKDIVINNSNPIYADNENRLGRAGANGEYCRGKIYLSECYIKIGNDYYFNGASMRKADYTVYGNPTITEDTITTPTVTQKPFNQNVTINSSEIQEGTKYLVDYPGMFQIKTEDNTLAVKFLFEDKPAWKYIKQEELVEGDNVLSLVSDTEKLKFIVNSTEHVLVDTLPRYKSGIVDFPTNTHLLEHIVNGSFIIANRVLKNNSSVTKDNCQLNSSCSFETGDKQSTLTVSGTISSEGGCDYGALYVGTAEYKMTRNNMKNAQTDGNGEYAIVGAGSVSVENKEITLQPNTKYYINIAYAKDGSSSSGTDNIQITKFVLSEPINIVIPGEELPELTAGYLGYREGWKQV